MAGDTTTFCNYCESQSIENGRCTGCGASSWKYGATSKQKFPTPQSAANSRDISEADSKPAGASSVFDLIESAIRLIEKLVFSAMTIIKYKLIFIFSIFALIIVASFFGSDSDGKKNNITVSKMPSKHTSEPPSVASIEALEQKRTALTSLKAPSPPMLIDINQKPKPFSIPEKKWGAHFNPANLVPDEGFLAFYFDSSNNTQLANPVQVKDINIEYSYSDFRGIYSGNLGAYWVGKITTNETEIIEVIAKKGWNEFRVIIDGAVVQAHSRQTGQATLIEINQEFNKTVRAPGEKMVVLNEEIDKVYPKSQAGNPLVTLEPGDHLVEIELLNNWHTTKFDAHFRRVRTN